MTEQYGGVWLPKQRHAKITYNPDFSKAQQVQAQQVASFAAHPNDNRVNGSVLDVNVSFIVYAVKNGLIRVLHKQSSLRGLLKAHEEEKVMDLSFFESGDILGSVGKSVIVWRIFERAPEIVAEPLLEIPPSLPEVQRLIWHPFNPNQFWLLHHNEMGSTVATLVETTRIKTAPSLPNSKVATLSNRTSPHAVCQLFNSTAVMEGAVQLPSSGNESLTDLCWSGRDARHVLTTYDDGSIRLWDIKEVDQSFVTSNGTVAPTCIKVLKETEPVSRCLFLPHDNVGGTGLEMREGEEALTNAFLTATNQNSCVSIWSPFASDGSAPVKQQELRIDNEKASITSCFNMSMVWGQMLAGGEPPASFLLLSDREEGKLLAIHLASEWSDAEPKRPLAVGFDYLIPFRSQYPTYSWSITCAPAEQLEDHSSGGLNFDVRMYSLQSKAVQQMALQHFMCVPPNDEGWNDDLGSPGLVRVQELEKPALEFDDYDVEDDDIDDDQALMDEEAEDEFEAPEASELPPPGIIGGSTTGNPFANWLGAIAAKSTPARDTSPGPPLPPPPTPAVTPATGMMATKTPPPGLLDTIKIPAMELPEVIAPPPEPNLHLLSPMALLDANNDNSALPAAAPPKAPVAQSQPQLPVQQQPQEAQQRGRKKSPQRSKSPARNKGKNKKNNQSVVQAPGAVQILKRDDRSPATTNLVEKAASAPSGLDQDSIKKLIAQQFKQHEKHLVNEVQRAVRTEIQTVLIPELSRSMEQTMVQTVVRPMQSSMDKAFQQTNSLNQEAVMSNISASVEEPLKHAFVESMKSTLIPAYEAATREMYTQVADSATANSSVNAALAQKLDAMAGAMAALTKEVTELRAAVARGNSENNAVYSQPAPPAVDPLFVMRNEILGLLQKHEFEKAFTKALSASTTDMAVFCCKNADLSACLGGNRPALSQPILLCLMQQLSAVLLTSRRDDVETELSWLQEIALTLQPTNPNIIRHVPDVLMQLEGNINTKMSQNDPSLRRPLQMLLQVIRGMQR